MTRAAAACSTYRSKRGGPLAAPSKLLACLCLFLCLLPFVESRAVSAPSGDMTRQQEWVWSQLSRGLPADLDVFCADQAAPVANKSCHTIPADFLTRLITEKTYLDALPRQGLQVSHALVVGDVDLVEARVGRQISIVASTLLGGIDLTRAQLASQLSLEGSTVAGRIDCSGLRTPSDLRFERLSAKGELVLIDARIDGNLDLADSTLDGKVSMNNASVAHDVNLARAVLGGDFDASSAHLGGRGYLAAATFKKRARLVDLTTDGDLWLDGATFAGEANGLVVAGSEPALNLNSARIGGALRMLLKQAGRVGLHNVHVRDNWYLSGHFTHELDASAFHSGGNVAILPGTRIDGPVNLNSASIDGGLRGGCSKPVDECAPFPAVRFGADVDARLLHATGTLSFIGVEADGGLTLEHAEIGGDLDFQWQDRASRSEPPPRDPSDNLARHGTTLRSLDLTNAKINGELRLGSASSMVCWSGGADGTGPALRLTAAQVGVLVHPFFGWPQSIAMQGLAYNRFDDGSDGVAPTCPSEPLDWRRPPNWRAWLTRDGSDSIQPYVQLASVLASEGMRDEAARVQFVGRQKERRAACGAGRTGTCVYLWLLEVLGGYGIGNYTWRALVWVGLLAVLGAVAVFTVHQDEPPPLPKRVAWCCGAALEKLLPYVQLDRGFTVFFEEAKGFRLWHKAAFAALALAGSVLGLFLAAAASGLTQKG